MKNKEQKYCTFEYNRALPDPQHPHHTFRVPILFWWGRVWQKLNWFLTRSQSRVADIKALPMSPKIGKSYTNESETKISVFIGKTVQ